MYRITVPSSITLGGIYGKLMNSLYTPNHKLKLEATQCSRQNHLRTHVHVPGVAVPACVDINTLCSDSKWPERITTPTLREPSISFTLKLELPSPTASTVVGRGGGGGGGIEVAIHVKS